MIDENQAQQGYECLLNIEGLTDPRNRENHVYTETLKTLLDEGYSPDNPDICLRIKEICLALDRLLEDATFAYRQENGTPYVNDPKTKEVKIKPVPYRQLNVSLAESQRLAGIYAEKHNARQIEIRQRELSDFPETPNLELFHEHMEQLKALYDFTEKDTMYVTHWLTNVKRTILERDIELPQILCFTSIQQHTGKSTLARTMAKVINKRVITTDLQKLSARFQPLTLTTEAVLWIDELKKIDKTISDNIKTLITTDTIDFEFKGRNGYRQYRKLASLIMSINYDPSAIFYEDERQRRIAPIQFNRYTERKSREELETLIQGIWENTPIEYTIAPDTIAQMTFNEVKENSALEYFICQRVYGLLAKDRFYTATEIINSLYSYTGNRNRVMTLLKNAEHFTQGSKTNGVLKFKATETFKALLRDELDGREDPADHYIYDFRRAS